MQASLRTQRRSHARQEWELHPVSWAGKAAGTLSISKLLHCDTSPHGECTHHSAVFFNGNTMMPSEREALPETAALAVDVSKLLDTNDNVLCSFDMDYNGNLFVTDHSTDDDCAFTVEGEKVPRNKRMQLHPGCTLDLSGSGEALVFKLTRDEHCHA